MNPAAESHRLTPRLDQADSCPECGQTEPAAFLELLRRWHDERHPGAFTFCQQQPCHAANNHL